MERDGIKKRGDGVANIKDLAKLSGVSVTTVSRVLNNHPYVSNAKREAVKEAIKATGYHQNINAVHLSTGQTHLIGVVLPFLDHPYFTSVVKGLAQAAKAKGKHIVLFETSYQQEKEQAALAMLETKQIDAVIFCSRAHPLNLLEKYVYYGPVVLFENVETEVCHTTFIDHSQVFTEALEYLYKQGHRRIGYSVYRQSGTNSMARKKAYQSFLSRHDLPVNTDYIFTGCLHAEDGKTLINQLKQLPLPPTAMLVTSDQVAAGMIIAAKKAEVMIPQELALIGFNDEPIASLLDLTTIKLPLEQIGESLLEQALSKQVTHRELEATFIQRKTVEEEKRD